MSQPLIDYFAKIFFVFWEYSYNFDIVEMVKYIFFPNIVSQSYNVMHMKNTYHAIFEGNTEWIYFMLSCWNVYIMPLAILGGVQCIRKKQFKQIGLWGVIFINIAMLYGVFYGSVSEPRHKLMIIYPLAFLVSVGIEEMSQRRRVLYFIFVTLIIY